MLLRRHNDRQAKAQVVEKQPVVKPEEEKKPVKKSRK